MCCDVKLKLVGRKERIPMCCSVLEGNREVILMRLRVGQDGDREFKACVLN